MHLWGLFISVHMTAFRWGESIKKGMGRQDREKACLCWWQHTVVSAQLHLEPEVRTWKQPLANVAPVPSPAGEVHGWAPGPGKSPRMLQVLSSAPNQGTSKGSWTDAVSTQTLFRLKEDCTSNASTVTEWSFASQRHLAEKCSWFQVYPSKGCRAIYRKSKVDSRWVPEFCQSCIFTALGVKDFTWASGSFL